MSMILLAASSASHSGATACLNGLGACGQWSSYDADKIVEITAALEEVRWDEAIVCVTH